MSLTAHIDLSNVITLTYQLYEFTLDWINVKVGLSTELNKLYLAFDQSRSKEFACSDSFNQTVQDAWDGAQQTVHADHEAF